MDKSTDSRLLEGARRMAVELPEGAGERLCDYARELLRWNAKVNLTAITDWDEVVEKHLLDSLAVLPEVQGATTLLDLGAGAGLPGLPLALVLPELQVVMVDGVGKKVAFMKNAIARLGLAGRVRAEQLHAAGKPEAEKLPRSEVVISRALMDVGPWLRLARAYLAPKGRVVAMLGQVPPAEVLAARAAEAGLELSQVRVWTLPFSGDGRGAAVFRPG